MMGSVQCTQVSKEYFSPQKTVSTKNIEKENTLKNRIFSPMI